MQRLPARSTSYGAFAHGELLLDPAYLRRLLVRDRVFCTAFWIVTTTASVFYAHHQGESWPTMIGLAFVFAVGASAMYLYLRRDVRRSGLSVNGDQLLYVIRGNPRVLTFGPDRPLTVAPMAGGRKWHLSVPGLRVLRIPQAGFPELRTFLDSHVVDWAAGSQIPREQSEPKYFGSDVRPGSGEGM